MNAFNNEGWYELELFVQKLSKLSEVPNTINDMESLLQLL